MNILITNDDGYYSPGILRLKEVISSSFNVFLCAPLSEKSASSHSITLFKRMELKKLDEQSYAVDGTPADCVKVALLYLFKDVRFDIVISGINYGPNMGDDIFYSGTVAGAREGLLNKIFSMAISVDGWEKDKCFDTPAFFVSELIKKFERSIFSEKILLNINFPKISEPLGVKITHLGRRVYRDSIIFENYAGKDYVTIGGDDPDFEPEDDSDLQVVSEGFISITPLTNEIYDLKIIKKLSYLEGINWKSLHNSQKILKSTT
ncbi:MAG: 5'/3'-nucleotidase SurE [Brevinematia bacterium]